MSRYRRTPPKSVGRTPRASRQETTSAPDTSEAAAAPARLPAPRALTRADVLLALGLIAGALALYAITACRTIFAGDSAELATAAAVFGVPHPPGYPLYTLLVGTFVHLVPVGELAFRANLASGLFAAAAAGLAFLFLRRLHVHPLAASFATLTLAAGRTFWSQSVVAEVYTLDLLLLVGVLHAATSVVARAAPRSAFVLGATCALWVGHRSVNVIYLLPLVIGVVALIDWSTPSARFARLVGFAAAGGVLLLGVYVYLPLASLMDPPLDIGAPRSWDRFTTVVSAAPYRRHLFAGLLEHDWGRFVGFLTSLPVTAGAAALLAVPGWLRVLDRSTATGISVGLCLLAGLTFASRYNILDVEVYFLVPTLVLALLGGIGLDALLQRGRVQGAAAAGVAIASSVALVVVNYPHNDLSEHRFARVLGEDLLRSVDPEGVLFVNGDTSIHSLWYLQTVEGVAPDVIVVSLGHLWPWYHEQLVARHPEAPWPDQPPKPEPQDQLRYARRLVERFASERPLYFTLSVVPQYLLGATPGGPGRTMLKGLVQEIRLPGSEYSEEERLEIARQNAAFLEDSIARLGDVPDALDMDTHSTLLEYAAALTVTAEELARAGEAELVGQTAAHVQALEADRLERAVAQDVLSGLGQRVPLQRFEERARRAAELAGAQMPKR